MRRTIELWCGPGNNGGDGFVAASLLRAWGKEARLVIVGDPARSPDDARHAWQGAQDAGVPVLPGMPERVQADLAIDALLGLGVNRALDGALAAAVNRLNDGGCPVLAVDLPSGLHSDTGVVQGVAVRAAHTLALLALKPGLFTAHGRDHAGRVWFDDLMVADAASPIELAGRDAAHALSAPRLHAQHKGSFGDVVVIGGASGMVGAAVLAARAALAAGAGRVYLGLLAAVEAAWFEPAYPELMSRTMAQLLVPAALDDATVVCGCGGGAAVREVLPTVLHHARRLVLDADGLNTIAGDAGLARALRARAARNLATVLTPHPLEAARLLRHRQPRRAGRSPAGGAAAGRGDAVHRAAQGLGQHRRHAGTHHVDQPDRRRPPGHGRQRRRAGRLDRRAVGGARCNGIRAHGGAGCGLAARRGGRPRTAQRAAARVAPDRGDGVRARRASGDVARTSRRT